MTKKDYLIAGMLALPFGIVGAQHWYMKNYGKAITYTLIALIGALFTCGISTITIEIIGIVEGIQLLATGISMDEDYSS